MNNIYYKHIQEWERNKIASLVESSPTIEPIYGMTNHGWDIIRYKFLVDISYIALRLGRERKTIKNELIRGAYWTPTKDIAKASSTFSYSPGASKQHHLKVAQSRKKQQLKIFKYPKLEKFIKDNLQSQSLKGLGGRTKKEFKNRNIEATISSKTLYNYIDNSQIDFINISSLKRRNKRKYKLRRPSKRQNGISIDERPIEINNRSTFGHWEIDLIEGKRPTKCNLLTLSERKTRFGIAIKIHGKSKYTITKAIRKLQETNVLSFGANVLSITTDNGSEFWDWKKFGKSIYNCKDDIPVYFCHPYASYEKGGVENFNEMIRYHYPKGTDFTKLTQSEINATTNVVNGVFRESLNYYSAKEVYNNFNQI